MNDLILIIYEVLYFGFPTSCTHTRDSVHFGKKRKKVEFTNKTINKWRPLSGV